MKSPDPASLQNLNDIVLPATVGWWPLAPGWYILFASLLIALAWSGYRLLHRWKNNRYRRAALRELQLLKERIHATEERDAEVRDAKLRQIPVLRHPVLQWRESALPATATHAKPHAGSGYSSSGATIDSRTRQARSAPIQTKCTSQAPMATSQQSLAGRCH